MVYGRRIGTLEAGNMKPLRALPIYYVGRFARVTHRRIGTLWWVFHTIVGQTPYEALYGARIFKVRA